MAVNPDQYIGILYVLNPLQRFFFNNSGIYFHPNLYIPGILSKIQPDSPARKQ